MRIPCPGLRCPRPNTHRPAIVPGLDPGICLCIACLGHRPAGQARGRNREALPKNLSPLSAPLPLSPHGRTEDEDAYELSGEGEIGEGRSVGLSLKTHWPPGTLILSARPVRVRWGRPAEAGTSPRPATVTLWSPGKPGGDWPQPERTPRQKSRAHGAMIASYNNFSMRSVHRPMPSTSIENRGHLVLLNRGHLAAGRFDMAEGKAPSSAPTRHLLPPGEKGSRAMGSHHSPLSPGGRGAGVRGGP